MLYKDTNQIKRNYYLNLFSTNAEIKKSPYSILSASGASTGGNGNQNQNQNGGGGNGNQNQNQNQGGGTESSISTNNNWIYEWNIRDLQLSKYAEIALIQIANNNADYTEERQYPPKLFNTFEDQIQTSNDIFNIAPIPYYKETITLNTTDITYGSGKYEIYSSSINGTTAFRKRDLFNYNTILDTGGPFATNQYTPPNGFYTNTDKYIENGYYGDWLIIKLPNPIILTKFTFIRRTANSDRAPGLWRCYGSVDGITFTEIKEASNDINSLAQSNYINAIYEKTLTKFNTPYLYIGWTINKLCGVSSNSTLINMLEIQIFGREPITRIKQRLTEERAYPPKLYNTFTNEITTTAELSNILPTTFYKQNITLNTTGISYGSGDYILYSSSMYPHPTLEAQIKKLLLFDYNNDDAIGAHWNNNNYTNGVYNKSNYIVSDYTGDWIILKLPNPIILTKFSFSQRIATPARAPAEWKCYGSNDGITFTEITQASQLSLLATTDYIDYIYTKTFNNLIPYLYIGFTFKKLLGIDIVLNFAELRLFGKEEIKYLTEEREYPPKLFNIATAEETKSGEILNINPSTYIKEIVLLNTDGINYGSGRYEIYSSGTTTELTRTRTKLFNYVYGNITDAGAYWGFNNYNVSTGLQLNNRYIKSNYFGEWSIIKFPNPLILIHHGRIQSQVPSSQCYKQTPCV